MKFDFKNIGIVESAEIELKGLTVITGLNDTGKSFLSKAMYSVVKTNKESSLQSRIIKNQQLQQYFGQIQNAESLSLAGSVIPEQRILYPASELYNKIVTALTNNLSSDEINSGLNEYSKKIVENFSNNKNAQIKVQFEVSQNKLVADSIANILNMLTITNQPDKDNIDFFNKIIIQQLFKGQINSTNDSNSLLEIKVNDDSKEIYKINVKNNLIENYEGTPSNNFYSDAILIESPIILQLISFILNGLAFGGSLIPQLNLAQPRIAGLPFHFYDLTNKIVNNAGNSPTEEFSLLINSIQEIIGGKLYYDVVSRSILFDKGSQGIVKDNNIASGIKALGTLGLLLSENVINKKTLLIIDEPEVHLHPKWEVKYAEMIVQLSKAGIPIIISSHSPDLLEAITTYVKIFDTKEITKFYFGQKPDGGNKSIFHDVTEDLEPIFKALADPIHDLFFNSKK